MTTQKETLTLREACALLGISYQHGYGLERKGRFPGARRLGQRIIVSRKAIDEFLAGEHDDA